MFFIYSLIYKTLKVTLCYKSIPFKKESVWIICFLYVRVYDDWIITIKEQCRKTSTEQSETQGS
jgi:hypothetical protein